MTEDQFNQIMSKLNEITMNIIVLQGNEINKTHTSTLEDISYSYQTEDGEE